MIFWGNFLSTKFVLLIGYKIQKLDTKISLRIGVKTHFLFEIYVFKNMAFKEKENRIKNITQKIVQYCILIK